MKASYPVDYAIFISRAREKSNVDFSVYLPKK